LRRNADNISPIRSQRAVQQSDNLMLSFSVVITASNNGSVLRRTLQSAEAAIAFFQGETQSPTGAAEIVAVDDGSSDDTPAILEAAARINPLYRLVRHPSPTSPSHARNAGVAVSQGELLFFLDGDDLFFETHILGCVQALSASPTSFVKTGVRLADPVHPDWRQRIEGSLALNLCVRRACHDAVGGFPDFHLFRRAGEHFLADTDLFYKYEDQYYNVLVTTLFTGLRLACETVEYIRYPGNSFDRQYEKFCRPYGAYQESLPPETAFRLQMCQLIVREQLRQLRAQGVSDPPAAQQSPPTT